MASWAGHRERRESPLAQKKAELWADEQRDPILDLLVERLSRAQGRRAEALESCRRAEKGKRSKWLDDLAVLDGFIILTQKHIEERKEQKYVYSE